MNIVEAIVLGIIQGLTEFLPISSTAHLRVAPELLGWPDRGAAFTAVIQLGTLLAVLIYFRRDIVRLLVAVLGDLKALRFGTTPDAKLAWLIAVGTVPVVVGGLTLKKWIERDFRSLWVIAGATIVFALLLGLAELVARARQHRSELGRPLESVGWGDAIFIGLMQALALVPGASRSGTTITGGLFTGLERGAAARFSFLLSLPAVFAAGVYELYKERHELLGGDIGLTNLLVASAVSFVVGYASIAFLLNFLKKNTTFVFIVYRLLFGAALLYLLYAGRLSPLPALAGG